MGSPEYRFRLWVSTRDKQYYEATKVCLSLPRSIPEGPEKRAAYVWKMLFDRTEVDLAIARLTDSMDCVETRLDQITFSELVKGEKVLYTPTAIGEPDMIVPVGQFEIMLVRIEQPKFLF